MTRMKWLTWTENWIKKVFLKMCDMAKSGFETLSLTMILIFNLFFIVFLLLAVCTVLVLTGVDCGFLYSNGQISIGSVLCFKMCIRDSPCIKSTGMTSQEFCTKLLEQKHVALVPGDAFGASGEGYCRVSYAYSVEHLTEAMKRIREFLKENGINSGEQ